VFSIDGSVKGRSRAGRDTAELDAEMLSPLTGFFGREAAIAELAQILEANRLVTLIGAPGCGKTRLGIELVAQLAREPSEPVTFVELAPVTDPSAVPALVATALGVRDRPGRSVEETLVEALVSASGSRLVALDNCEHVVDAVATLAARLLDASRSLRVLATSRIALGLQGERVWRVPPLDRASSVELFEDRAGLVSPAARDLADSADCAVFDQIVARLDGLPLAIELTAAWARIMTPSQILARLDEALVLLRSAGRDMRSRQQTMEATVEGSYQLLQPAEQLLFEQLSVFAGGFDLEAATSVTSCDGTLDGVASLVDHSLVTVEPGSAGVMRYRLLEPLRRCAEAWLVGRGDAQVTRRRHAEHYLEVALRADARLRESEPQAVLAMLEDEDGNLRAALEWARHKPGDLGLRLCTALAPAWAIRGRVNEARGWIEEMLRVGTECDDLQLRASSLDRASRLAWRQRDYQSARVLLEESLAIERDLDDPRRVARRMRSLAVLTMAQGDLDNAERLCEQSIALFREHDDRYGLSLALAFLGLTLQISGQSERAAPHVQEALELNRANGNVTGALYSLGAMAFGAVAARDIARLRQYTTEIAQLLRVLGGKHEDPSWLWWMGVALASGEGRDHSALRLFGAADAIARRDGLDLHERLRQQVLPWLWRARLRLGQDLAEELAVEGSRLTLEQLLDEALTTTNGDQDGADSERPLSPREREVVDLIAEGLTNTEIAERLVISRRTVETHVQHIKTKLGFRRRARVIAWALERQHLQQIADADDAPTFQRAHAARRTPLRQTQPEAVEEDDAIDAKLERH
jgi:predicted ATPase/DNA-binding CsgD family transcriptional regulator